MKTISQYTCVCVCWVIMNKSNQKTISTVQVRMYVNGSNFAFFFLFVLCTENVNIDLTGAIQMFTNTGT